MEQTLSRVTQARFRFLEDSQGNILRVKSIQGWSYKHAMQNDDDDIVYEITEGGAYHQTRWNHMSGMLAKGIKAGGDGQKRSLSYHSYAWPGAHEMKDLENMMATLMVQKCSHTCSTSKAKS